MDLRKHLSEHPVFEHVAAAAEELQLDTYVVGGYVRDLLLSRPSKDIDFVCVGDGPKLARAVAKKLGVPGKVTIFKKYGTANLRYEQFELEFVGARKESYSPDSRNPEVTPGTLEDDQKRRDFTINALAISLNKASYGELVDPFNGQKDLKRKLIRTPLEPGITFSDDPLRMMRAIRFATQLTFDIEPDTFQGITDNRERIDMISQERITSELNKIILSEKPSYGFKLLYHAGLLERIFPELQQLQGVETIKGMSHKDNFYHTLEVLDNTSERSDDLWLRWAAILHDIAKPATKRFDPQVGWTFHGHEDRGARMVPRIFRKMKLPMNEPMNYVRKLVRLHLRPIALVKDQVTDTAVRRLLFEAGDDVEDLMKLCKADVTSKNDNRVRRYLANFKKVEQKMRKVEATDRIRNFQPPVSGDDIMQTFGIQPGREVGTIKDSIKEAILEGDIRNNREEAWQYMLREGEKLGLKKVVENN